MKEQPDVKVTGNNLKIYPQTFIWHKLGINTLSHYGDRALETLPQINLNCYRTRSILRERRPPWPRQIITPILSTVKMLSLGCERLPTPLKKKKKKRVLDHYLHHDLGMLPLLRCFFAHSLILQYPDHHQNLISSYLYYSGPVHKISSQSVHNFLSNVVHRQTNKQTNRQTN